MNPPSAGPTRQQTNSISFRVRLTPKSSADRIEGWVTGADGRAMLKARVTAPPEKGKANASLVAMLAKRLNIPKSAIAIVSGETSRLKSVRVTGDTPQLAAKLQTLREAK